EQRRREHRAGRDELVALLSLLLRRAARRDVSVLEDDVQEDVAQEVALRLRDGLAEVHFAADAEGFRHLVHDAVDRAALLRAAREVDAAEHRRLTEDAALEELRDEVSAALSQRGELLREAVHKLASLELA